MSNYNSIGQITPTPQCIVALSGNQTITQNTITVVTLDTVVLDTTNSYNSLNHRYTPNIAGNYLVLGNFIWTTTVGTYRLDAILRKNGATNVGISQNAFTYNAGGQSQSPSCLAIMNGTTDYLELVANQTSTGGLIVQGNGLSLTYMSISLLR